MPRAFSQAVHPCLVVTAEPLQERLTPYPLPTFLDARLLVRELRSGSE
ncbi:MAG: hypothetical protein ABSH25_12660 [Syntrophorhabdales bacterium]